MRGLFIGRFQPFHRGHMTIIEKALEEADELVVGIGSAERSFSDDDPFTAGERIEMIRELVKDRSLEKRIMLVPIRDVNRYSIWVSHVLSLVPSIDVVFSNNPLTVRLFRKDGFEVRSTALVSREIYSGVHIRELIRDGKDWEKLVPGTISRNIRERGLDKRIRELLVSGDGP